MSTASKVNLVLLACLAGAYVPFNMGLLFLDPLVILPLGGLAHFYVGAAPGCGPWRTGLLGAGYASLVIALGVFAVNLGLEFGVPVLPVFPVAIVTPILSFSSATFAASWAQDHIARGNPPREAASRIRWTTLLLLIAWMMRTSYIPTAVRELFAPVTTTPGLATVALSGSCLLLLAARRMARGTPDSMIN